MKILFLTSRLPYPPFQGDRLKIYHILRILSRKHEITLLSFVENPQEAELAKELSSFCTRIETIIFPKLRSYQNLIFKSLKKEPFQVSYYESQSFRKKLNQLLQEESYDIIHTHLIRMASYTADSNIPRVLDLTDAISNYLESRYNTTKNPITKAGLFLEWQRMLKYESILQQFEAVSVCSEVDCKSLLKTAPESRIEIIRNGLDIDYFQPRLQQLKEPHTIIFTGNMAYAPNEDGLLYFYNEILPLIRQRIPHIKLYIVGKSPSETVKNLASDTVIVTGKVDDLRDYYARAQIAICPIRYGAGTLNKVIEPMAMAIPVVSTSIACVGMNVKPIENFEQNTGSGIQEYKDENIAFADTPETFAQAVVTLLKKPDLCKQIGINARKLVEKEHDWEQIVAKLEQIYQSISNSEGFEQLRENTIST